MLVRAGQAGPVGSRHGRPSHRRHRSHAGGRNARLPRRKREISAGLRAATARPLGDARRTQLLGRWPLASCRKANFPAVGPPARASAREDVPLQRWLLGHVGGVALGVAGEAHEGAVLGGERRRVHARLVQLAADGQRDPAPDGGTVVAQRVDDDRVPDRVVAADREVVGSVGRADLLQRDVGDPAAAGAQRRARRRRGVGDDDLVGVGVGDRVVDTGERLDAAVERLQEARLRRLLVERRVAPAAGRRRRRRRCRGWTGSGRSGRRRGRGCPARTAAPSAAPCRPDSSPRCRCPARTARSSCGWRARDTPPPPGRRRSRRRAG